MYLTKINAGDFPQSLLTSRSFVWGSQSLQKKSNEPKSRLWGAVGGFDFLILSYLYLKIEWSSWGKT